MTEISNWSFDKCNEWLNNPYNKPDKETDDIIDRLFYKEVYERFKILKDKEEVKNEK
tara:strand:+ start:363 stop:533 length:171 start_codon:yes stop_codon:yes gene_type:complete